MLLLQPIAYTIALLSTDYFVPDTQPDTMLSLEGLIGFTAAVCQLADTDTHHSPSHRRNLLAWAATKAQQTPKGAPNTAQMNENNQGVKAEALHALVSHFKKSLVGSPILH